MMTDHPVAARTLLLTALIACAVVGMVACGSGSDLKARARDVAAPDGSARSDGARRYADGELAGLLVPLGAVPPSLTPVGQSLMPNDAVAAFFPNRAQALSAMEKFGRIQGMVAQYRVPAPPRASEQAVEASSSVAWYTTVAGAQAVIADPTMELALHHFGLDAAEIKAERVGQESRMFRGFRDGMGPDFAAYLVLFRRENTIGAVMVVVPALSDDGGRLAQSLARRQASLPLVAGKQ
jgi:hypothetical protein